MRHRRPFVALKLATSADGRIATATGDSQWITGPAARAEGHRLRLRHDAILVGSGTALADDPMLTCRLPGLRAPLARPRGRSTDASGCRRTAGWRAAPPSSPCGCSPRLATDGRPRSLGSKGVTLFPTAGQDSTAALQHALATLAEQGITRVLVEGGATLATAFLRAGMVDLLYQFAAPC